MTKEIMTVSPFATNAANFSLYPTNGSTIGPVGELLAVKIGVVNIAGSLTLVETVPNGTIDVGVIATPSGTARFGNVFPVVTRTSTSNATLVSGANIYTPYVVTGPIRVVGSGYTSGTSNFISGIELVFQR